MTSKPPEGGSPKLTGNETQVIDLSEVEVLVQQHNLESQRNLEGADGSASQRSLPPPLPPSEVARASALPPSSPQPSQLPPEPAARSNTFYVVAIVAFLVIGIGGGVAIAKILTKPEPPPAASAAPTASGAAATVITIPTVEMNDTDAGK